jgi:glutamate/tyrosine decarboxylase-like PLP-dependent enzyme
MLGFGADEVERVAADDQGRMRADRLPELDSRCIVICQAGNVNSGSFDPFEAICRKAKAASAWVHVDGAFGLWGRVSPSLDAQTAGVQQADSWTVDSHKWLNTPMDCGLAVCRDPEAVRRVMATDAAYIRTGAAFAPKDMVPEFGRRARGVEVWAALHSLGRAGVRDLIERCCAHARRFAAGLEAMGFEVLNDVVLNQVVATIGAPGQIGQIMAHVQASGECWFGPTLWQARDAIRISVASWRTTEADVDRSLAAIELALKGVMAKVPA